MTESAFIAALRALPLHPGARGLLDDAAVLELGGEALVLTHDMIAEGVHYPPNGDVADTMWKLVAVNLSDLAAKGAEPIGVLFGASLGDDDEAMVRGLGVALEAFGVPLLGGDTIAPKSGAVFGLTAIGRATHRPVPARSGARPGDALWITGTIGAAMLGHRALTGGPVADTARYLRPTPRLAEGRALAPHVSAMMDVSDGLLLDAKRMAEASQVTIDIALAHIPFPASLPESERFAAASWGDDYELLFAAPADFTPPIPATRIGTVLPRGSTPLTLDGGPAPERLGYEHG